jgi:circadian clock protein KaiC
MIRESTDLGISSIMDTWILLRDIELGGERNRGIYVLKSRGMAHSNQIREFVITRNGIDLQDVYVGPEGVLTGSARLAQEARERAEQARRRDQTAHKQAELTEKKRAVEAQIAALEAQFAAEKEIFMREIGVEQTREKVIHQLRGKMGRLRQADGLLQGGNGNSSRRTKDED